MRIGFSFFGIIQGPGGRTGSDRDYKHCWPGLKRDLIDPFIEQGHEAKIYFSGYTFDSDYDEDTFRKIVNPDNVVYSHLKSSDPFTSKFASFNNLIDNDDIDVVIFTRSDIHFSRIMANENIDFTKINFLFPELGWWDTFNFTCDNFYVIPKEYLRPFRRAMEETYRWPRPDYVDTHGLMNKLVKYVDPKNFHFISNDHELSDVNSFYTCCRSGLPVGEERMKYLHLEVAERFYR